MLYDPLTLWSLVVFITLVLSGILLLTWITTPDSDALAYWSAALLLSGLNIAGIAARDRIPDFVSIELANAAGLLGASFMWLGFRRFDGRSLNIPVATIAPAIWLIACQFPLFQVSISNRVMLFAVLILIVGNSCIVEVWRGRQERIVARFVAIAVLLTHILIVASRIVVVQIMDIDRPGGFLMRSDPVFALYGLAWLAFLVIITFTMVAMVRERRELAYKQASVIDELTGLLNRRGFMEQAARACMPGMPVVVLALDLDRFKDVNDRHGHATGDDLLAMFARVLRAHLRPADLVARMGGEEFGVLMPNVNADGALEVAERIRQAFSAAAGELKLAGVAGTVSIGVAAETVPIGEAFASVSPMLARADHALYRAKANGRDRVEFAWDQAERREATPVLHIVR